MNKEKKAAAAAKANGPLEDGRYACAVCGRKFAEDRIPKHQVICRRNAARGPRARFKTAEEMRLERKKKKKMAQKSCLGCGAVDTGGADGKRPDRHTAGHLNNRKKAIQAV